MPTTPEIKKLPISVPCKDKLEFAYKLLNLYSVLVMHLNSRNIDILAAALVFGVNAPDFKETIIGMNIGIKNDKHITVELSRLKTKGLIVPHAKYNRKVLHPHMEAFNQLIHSEDEKIMIELTFLR